MKKIFSIFRLDLKSLTKNLIVFVVVIGLIMSFTENGFLIFTEENIEQTYLFKILMNFSPFK